MHEFSPFRGSQFHFELSFPLFIFTEIYPTFFFVSFDHRILFVNTPLFQDMSRSTDTLQKKVAMKSRRIAFLLFIIPAPRCPIFILPYLSL